MRRERHLINHDWTFAWGERPGAELAQEQTGWEEVGLPHSFGQPDFREQAFYVGFGCYRRDLHVDPASLGCWIALEFLGVFQVTEVFVNGMMVGRHEGGYTPFVVDISDAVAAGSNDLLVRVDNRWNARLAPRAGDYSFCGGIYRDVALLVADRVRVDWYGIAVTTPTVDHERATVEVSVDIVNDLRLNAPAQVQAAIRHDGRVVATMESVPITAAAQEVTQATLRGTIIQPQLWHPEHPHLYQLDVQVIVDGVVSDADHVTFGVRWFEFTADRGFFLNGQHLLLHGANVHQNHGGWADAVTQAGLTRDLEMVKDLGMNIIRGSHYPHHLHVTAECDRLGLMYWSELHFWGIGGTNIEGSWFASAYPPEPVDQPEFEESLRRALREMIRTQRNHPSILTWSIGNEAFFTDEGVVDRANALTRELVDLAHELDPTRPAAVGGAQRRGFDVLGDIAGYNGDGAELFIEPGIPSVVSEYHGAGGLGSGEYGAILEHGVEADPSWRAGKILWCAFRYRTIAEGAGLGGIVDYFRVPRRPYYWFRHWIRGIEPPTFPQPGSAAAVRLETDTAEIPIDGTGDAKLTVTLLDEWGTHIADAVPVTLDVLEGDGRFPAGRSITLGPDPESMTDGMSAIEVRAYHAGRVRVRASSPGLRPAEVVFDAVGDRPWQPRSARRLAGGPPQVTSPPVSGGSLADFRPVTTSSAAQGYEGSHVTDNSASHWNPADDSPEQWLQTDLEFPYQVDRVEIEFLGQEHEGWLLETSTDRRTYDIVHTAEPGGEMTIQVGLGARLVRCVRVRFPRAPAPISRVSVYGVATDSIATGEMAFHTNG